MSLSDFWRKLEELSNRIKLDSISVGPARLKLVPNDSSPTEVFSELISKVSNNPDKNSDVFAISAHNVDEIIAVDRIDPDHESAALTDILRVPGGSGANTAYALGRLGVKVSVTGVIGEDEEGQLLIDSLKSANVDITEILRGTDAPTGKTIILVESGGKRSIVVFPGINNQLASRASYSALLQKSTSSKIVHLSSFAGHDELKLQERLVQEIADTSLISMTPGALYVERGLDYLKPILCQVDILFLYEKQLRKLVTNSSAKPLLAGDDIPCLLEAYFAWKCRNNLNAPQVLVMKSPIERESGVITRLFLTVGAGRDSLGTFLGPKELPPGTRIKAVDTTGSGDAAAAGFLFGVLQQASLQSCVESAFLMASLAAMQIGSRTGFTDKVVAELSRQEQFTLGSDTGHF